MQNIDEIRLSFICEPAQIAYALRRLADMIEADTLAGSNVVALRGEHNELIGGASIFYNREAVEAADQR